MKQRVVRGNNQPFMKQRVVRGNNQPFMKQRVVRGNNQPFMKQRVVRGNNQPFMKQRVVRGNNQPFMKQRVVRGNNQPFMKQRVVRGNNQPFMKQRVVRGNNQQRNFLLVTEKKKYFNKLNLKILDDNKKFWEVIKPLFSNNGEVAEKLNNFFIKAMETLEIGPFAPNVVNNVQEESLETITKKYETHLSILKIKQIVNARNKTFTFTDTTPNIIKDEISKLNPKKASVVNDIPTKILIASRDIVCSHLSKIYNNSKNDYTYPKNLKLADVIPVHKKEETTLLKNYRPTISLVPIVSKLYERNMCNQIISYIDNFLSPYLFRYRKGYSTEHCLTVMLEQWEKALDDKGTAGAILTDLSKAFDCLNHNLLLSKMEAYGFDKGALEFIQDDLKGRRQRTRVNDTFSSWLVLKNGVPQGSILGPLLFNIFLNDMFYFIKDAKMANYADDNTVYTSKNNIEDLLKSLEDETSVIIDWF